MNKYLIIGAAGFIGSNFTRYILDKEEDCKITVIDNLSAGKRENLPIDKRLTFFGTDVRHINQIPDLQRDWSDTISVLFSGIAPLPINEINPQFAISNNVGGTAEWLKFHKRWGVKLAIFASTNAVYENSGCKESDNISPNLIYPMTKKWGEELCSAYTANYRLPTVSVRFSNVYGPAANSEREQPALFSYLIRELLNNRIPTIYNASDAKRDYIYIDDLCDLLYLITNSTFYPIINACSGESLTTLEIYDEIYKQICGNIYTTPNVANPCKYWDKFSELFDGKFPLKYTRVLQEVEKRAEPSNNLARKLGWEPKVKFKDGIARTIKFEKERMKIV